MVGQAFLPKIQLRANRLLQRTLFIMSTSSYIAPDQQRMQSLLDAVNAEGGVYEGGVWHRMVNKFVSIVDLARRGMMSGLHLAESLLAIGPAVWQLICWPVTAARRTFDQVAQYAGDIAFCGTVMAILAISSIFKWYSIIPMLLNAIMLTFSGDSILRKTVAGIATLYSTYRAGHDWGSSYRGTNVTINTTNNMPAFPLTPHNLEPQAEEVWNPASMLFSSVAKVMACVLSLVLVTYLPATASFDGLLRRFDMVPKAIRGITSMTEAVESGLHFALGEHYRHFFGDATILSNSIPDIIIDHAKEVLALSVADTYTRIPSDPALCEKISLLYNSFNRFRIEFSRNKTVQQYLDKYAGSMINLFMKVSNHSPRHNENRPKPTVLMLKGGTGVGKSKLLYFLAASLMAKEGMLDLNQTDTEINDAVASAIYARAIEQEYWDAYNGQFVCMWDDFGQNVDSLPKPNLEFFELIRACNTFPYPLHMPDLSQKANTYFKSPYMICTTNLEHITPVSVQDANAVRSRLEFCYEVTVKPEFRKGTGNDEISKGIDSQKVMNILGVPVSLDVYEFQQFDPSNGAATGKYVTYEQLTDEMVAYHKRQQEIHDASKVAVANHVRKTLRPPLIPQAWPWSSPAQVMQETINAQVEEALYGVQRLHEKAKSLLEPYLPMMAFISAIGMLASFGYVVYKWWRAKGKLDPESGKSKSPVTPKVKVEGPGYSNRNLPALKAHVESSKSRDPATQKIKVEAKIRESDISNKALYQTPASERSIPQLGSGQRLAPEAVHRTVDIATGADWTEDDVVYTEYDGKAYRCVFAVTLEDGRHVYQKEVLEHAGFIDGLGFKEDVFEVWAEDTWMVYQAQSEKWMSSYPYKKQLLWMGGTIGFLVASAYLRLQPQAFACGQSCEVTQKILAKSYRFLRTQEAQILAPMVCIGDRTYIINTHYWNKLNKIEVFRVTDVFGDRGTQVSRDRIKATPFERKPGETTDATILEFPRTVPPGWALWRLFHSLGDFAAIEGRRVVMTSVHPTEPSQFHVKTGKITQQVTEPCEFDGGYVKSIMYHADIPSMPGDCGGIYVVDDKNIRGKVVGFHFAGASPGAMMLPLYYEDFEKIMEGKLEMVDIPDVEESVQRPPIPGAIVPHGITQKKIFSPTNTKFEKTPLYGKLGPVTTAPAVLAPILKEGGPGIKALAKVGGDVPHIDQNLIIRARESYRQKILVGGATENERRKLTFDEAVRGISGETYITGINRSRSAGWPWCLTTRTKGKTRWFGNDEWLLGESCAEVREAVERTEKQLAEGQWQPAVFVDTLKDETRTLDKVAAEKTRVFSAAPMDFVIIFRMYFLGFLAYTMRKKIHNEVAVGINALSPDWDILARHLRKKGNKIIAGDFTNYDGTLHPDVLYAVCDLINDFYDDEFREQRRILFENVVHSYHLAGKFVYGWTHSQPSGNPGTAVFNSMYNSLICRMVYYVLEEQQAMPNMLHDTFNDQVSMVSYGDDNLLSVENDWFTMEAMCPVMEQFGMTYTSEQKDGKTYKWKGLEECAFLQRGFRREGAFWYGPLGERSINDRLHWTQDSEQPAKTLQQNIVGAVAEWALHDKDTFEQWSTKIRRVSVQHAQYDPPIYPHKWYLEQIIYGNYTATFPMLTFT